MVRKKDKTPLDFIKEDGVMSIEDYKLAMTITDRVDVAAVLGATIKTQSQLCPTSKDHRGLSLCIRKLRRKSSKLGKPTNVIDNLVATLAKTHYSRPKKAYPIDRTPFYKNSLNLVFGASKSGKSYSIARVLIEANIPKTDVIWLDKDYNVNSGFINMLNKHFTHLNLEVGAAADALLEVDGNGKILVFDSLKDFAGTHNIDDNLGSQRIMESIREFTKMNYTVIVIAHATKSEKDGIKIKGNAETIASKSDIVFRLNDHTTFREFETHQTRLEGTHAGEVFHTQDLGALKRVVEAKIKSHSGPISVRDLTNSLHSNLRATFTKHKGDLIDEIVDGKKHFAKCRLTKIYA